jgi:hypothetical protein
MAPKKQIVVDDDGNPISASSAQLVVDDDGNPLPDRVNSTSSSSSGNWFGFQDKADKWFASYGKHKTPDDIRGEANSPNDIPGPIEANVTSTVGNVVGRAVAGVGSNIVHPLNALIGAYEIGKELVTVPLPTFNDETDTKNMQEYENANKDAPIHKRIAEFKEDYARSPREAIENLTGDVLGMYVSGKMFDAAGEPLKPVASAMKRYAAEKAAPGLIGRLIRPMAADVKFNKDPVSGILAEGIVGNDLTDIGEKVSDRMGEVGKELDHQASLPQNSGKVVDVKSSLKPIDDAMANAAKAGRTDVWNKLKDLREQLVYNWRPFKTAKGEFILKKTTPRNLNMSPAEALKFKRMVGDQVRWTQDPLQGDVNQAAGQVFRSLKDDLNQAVPALKGLNERYANLVGAAKAIQRRIPIENRNAHWSLSDIALGATGHIPLAIARKVAGSAPVTTRVAGAMYRMGKSVPTPTGIMPSIKSTAVGVGGVLNTQPKQNKPTIQDEQIVPPDPNRGVAPVTMPVVVPPPAPQSSVAKPRELLERAKRLNPSANGQVAYDHHAVNPQTGHHIASPDGKQWYDVRTGQQVA